MSESVRGDTGLWLLVALVLLAGCATDLGAVGSRGEEDAFARVLVASGVAPDVGPSPGETLSVEQARGLLGEVARARVTPRSFAPRRVLAWLLGEVLASGVPVEALSLTAEGELVLGRAVAAGAVRTPWGAGAGALSVVHLAVGRPGSTGGSLATTSPGPGRWVHKTPTTESEAARDYQEQVTGQPAWRVYEVDGVEFDGFTGGELLEAKGPSYKHFLEKDGTAKPWFEDGPGLESLLVQADRQLRIAQKAKVPLVWHVAEAEFAHFLRKTFQSQGFKSITVRHTSPTR